MTLITGFLGAGKTTLLRHLLETAARKMAILMNEFGEVAIDSQIIEGKSVRIAELIGGCVCCSLIGEFEAAVNEIIDTVEPDWIVVESTGVAEPDALIFEIQESLSRVRLDLIVTVVDADSMIKYPHLGHTTRLQIEAADLLLLNKADLVSSVELKLAEEKLKRFNSQAAILPTVRSRVDSDLLFGIGRERDIPSPHHIHQPDFESFNYTSRASLDRHSFEEFATALTEGVYRAKGFVRFPEGGYLFNFVSGRWELEPFSTDETVLVFIGKDALTRRQGIVQALRDCEKQAG